LVGKRRHVDFVKAIVDIAGVTLLLQQDSVSRRGEEDLLAEHVGNIRKQGDSGEHNEADPRLTRCDYVEVLAVELSLDLRGHEVDVEDDHTAVVQQEANCTRSHTQPVPEHCLEEQFEDDDVDDEGEGDRGGEPMLVSQSTAVNRSSQSVDCSEVTASAMPNGEENPAPEDLEVEVDTLLASCVKLGVLVDVLVVDILFNGVREKTLPRRPNGVVHGGEPLSKEDLTGVAVFSGEEDLSEDEHDVLVEVVAHEPRHSSVAPSAMNEEKSMQVHELTDGVVGRPDSLRSFLASDTDTDVSFHDHGHVVGAIAD